MGKVFDAFKNSKAWDDRYDLPLCPSSDNPFIYMAYVDLILQSHGEPELDRKKIHDHYVACLVKDPNQPALLLRGLIHRWPDNRGPVTSHDELMGIAHFDKEAAEEIVQYLNRNDGEYNDKGEKSDIPERFNLNRFPWFIAYLRSRAGYRVGLGYQFSWAVRLFIDGIKYDPSKLNDQGKPKWDQDGRNMTWLMGQEMRKYPLCNLALIFWQSKMERLRATPKRMFEDYLADIPEFLEFAPDKFWWKLEQKNA